MSPRTAPARDWAGGLPTEILDAIVPLLPSFADHIRFAGVCAPWGAAAKQALRRPPAPSPWVLLGPRSDAADGCSSVHFLRPSDGRLHGLHLSGLLWTKCVGISPDGWLVLGDLQRRQRLHAFNPVTGAVLHLPSPAAVPRGTPKVLHKVVLSSDPCAANAATGRPRGSPMFAAMLTRHWDLKTVVALARAGDRRWTPLDMGCMEEVFDVVYHQGKFYILGNLKKTTDRYTNDYCASIGVVDCGGDGNPLSAAKVRVVLLDHQHTELCSNDRLVASPAGELLLVDVMSCNGIRVFRVELHVMSDEFCNGTEGLRVVALADLGERALLVGHPSSTLVSTGEQPQFRSNCVYWIRDEGGCDMLVHDLKGVREEAHTLRGRATAAWFSPCVF